MKLLVLCWFCHMTADTDLKDKADTLVGQVIILHDKDNI